MKVNALKLRDTDFGNEYEEKVTHKWCYRDFQADPRWRNDWISFDCAHIRPADQNRVYLGITCFNADHIFYAYDRAADEFVDLKYDRIADPFDAKFHRSIVEGADGCLYATPALLHCADNYLTAPGAAIIRYDPKSGDIEKLDIPMPHVYIQSMVIDAAGETLYCQTFAPEYFISYHIPSGKTTVLGLIGSGIVGMTQGENLAIDDDGCVWCNWSLTRAWSYDPGPNLVRLSKYDPKAGKVIYFDEGLPYPDGKPGYSPIEAYFNLGDGAMHAVGANGSLYRIDTATGKATFLFTPTPDRRSRLSGMALDANGIAWGVTGRDHECELLRYDVAAGSYDKLGAVVDGDTTMFQCHDIVVTDDGVLYACENDVATRSSYLWEITV